MTKSIEQAQVSPKSWLLPVDPKTVKTRGPMGLPPGLHLMTGAKATGKTVTALAIAHWHRATQVPTTYAYVMEPRAEVISSLLEGGNWDRFLTAALRSTTGGLLIVDSLTYLLHRLTAVVALENEIGKVTYPGGLTPRDIYSCLLLDELARNADVAMIGTLNSELFPATDKLEGACEGQMKVLGAGTLYTRDRSSRLERPVDVPPTSMHYALNALGYSKGRNNLTKNEERA